MIHYAGQRISYARHAGRASGHLVVIGKSELPSPTYLTAYLTKLAMRAVRNEQDLPTRLFHWSFVVSIVGAFDRARGQFILARNIRISGTGAVVQDNLGVCRARKRVLKPSLWARKKSGSISPA